MTFKYVVKNVANRNGKTATFMPKPVFGDNGSGMHVHQSLWKGGKPLFYDAKGYAECSQLMLYYIGGLLTHIDSLLAFCAPTTNSYKRLVPHYEAPVNVAFSARNRSAAIRIPMFFNGQPKAKRLEFRPPDAMANPYLAFAALLCAGIDGIQKKIDPVKAGFGPLDKNIYDLPETEAARLRSVPGLAARDALGARERSRLPDRGRRLHRGLHPELDRLQDREGAQARRDPAASLRVRALLRRLSGSETSPALLQIRGPIWVQIARGDPAEPAAKRAAEDLDADRVVDVAGVAIAQHARTQQATTRRAFRLARPPRGRAPNARHGCVRSRS